MFEWVVEKINSALASVSPMSTVGLAHGLCVCIVRNGNVDDHSASFENRIEKTTGKKKKTKKKKKKKKIILVDIKKKI